MSIKKIISITFALFLFAGMVTAQNNTNYGKILQIKTISYDDLLTSASASFADRYLFEGQLFPVVSQDGKTVAFTSGCHVGLYVAPITGGDATNILIYDPVYSWEGVQYPTLCEPVAFSPDGKELYYKTQLLDAARGTTVTKTMVEEGRYTTSIQGGVPIIRKVNLKTKALTTVVEEVSSCNLSKDGHYLVYGVLNLDGQMGNAHVSLVIADLTTGKKRILADLGITPCFTPDIKYVIYSANEKADYLSLWQFYRVSVDGGVPEKISNFSKSDDFSYPQYPEVSPDGQWILFQGTFLVDSTTRKTGPCVLNLKTGKTYKALPNAEIMESSAEWLPDGSGFIYSNEKHLYELITTPSRHGCIYTVDFQPSAFWKPTGVAETAPVNFAIIGNFPNPFNPSTTISFSLPESGQASLAIYNASGQKVRELASGTLTAGRHSVVWDGRDQNGNTVSSGIYISRLTMNNKVTANRMLLVK